MKSHLRHRPARTLPSIRASRRALARSTSAHGPALIKAARAQIQRRRVARERLAVGVEGVEANKGHGASREHDGVHKAAAFAGVAGADVENRINNPYHYQSPISPTRRNPSTAAHKVIAADHTGAFPFHARLSIPADSVAPQSAMMPTRTIYRTRPPLAESMPEGVCPTMCSKTGSEYRTARAQITNDGTPNARIANRPDCEGPTGANSELDA